MSRSIRWFLFAVFFGSGCCALIYQVVWTRLAFASFGIIAPVLSVVISVFMLGLSGGAWAGGKWIGPLVRKTGCSALLFYALAELLIGIGGLFVPKLFAAGEQLLLSSGQMDSFRYLSLSALVLGFSILPWCFFMGATFPFMMAYVREADPRSADSFSYLYLANVLGAMTGCLLTAILFVEILGFTHTLWTAAIINFAIAATSGYLAWRGPRRANKADSSAKSSSKLRRKSAASVTRRGVIKWILFSTGFSAMAMEVIWARAFTPIMTTQVYSFALIVFAYLGATFFGSLLYRRDLRKGSVRGTASLISVLSIAAFLPIVCNDVRFLTNTANFAGYLSATVLLLSICPLCAALGYLTPSLIDEYSLGDPAAAGRAYAINVTGCILGPLAASYVLLPWLGERYGLVLLGLPFLVFNFFGMGALSRWYRWGSRLTASAVLIWSLFYSVDLAALVPRMGWRAEIRRDYAASVISAGEGLSKALLVNGVGMTGLVPITKFMAHLPLAFHTGKPESTLVICFGMGTSYRSALAWGIETTVVELVPSVRDAFAFFHADAQKVLGNPKGRVVIDDGRRYLKRTGDKFDVIVIDPPPPVEAAGSSLLYSEEFYELAKKHLQPNGILQTWYPGGNARIGQAVLRSLQHSFSHLRCFRSPGGAGMLVLASMEPVASLTPSEIARSMPSAAGDDLLEWRDSETLAQYLAAVVSNEFEIEQELDPDPRVRITDDHPYNEYFLLRRWGLF
ncbi:MAG: spermidine synthase [Verrucomicrobiota bacterium]|jgi:predicted membrane-bound spermidine synthase